MGIFNHIYMGLGSVVDVALASETEGRGFDPRLDARFLPQHVDPPINYVVVNCKALRALRD